MARKKTEAVAQAERVPEATGAQRYRARVYHEIETDGGVKRVDPGMIAAVEGDEINVYPPDAFPDEQIDEQE